jgi:glutamyl-tRNA reductase
MGEGQILAQVKQVYKVGQNSTGFGRQLNGLFKQAITAGKRVRSETRISTGGVSVSSAAVELAQLKLPTHSWSDAKVCIIGAGKMSTLLVKHLLSKGCNQVTILNRSLPRAQALQEEFPDMQMDIHLMPDLMQCVEDSDVVFAASGAQPRQGGWGLVGGAVQAQLQQQFGQQLQTAVAHTSSGWPTCSQFAEQGCAQQC